MEIIGWPAATPVPLHTTTTLGVGELFVIVKLLPTAPTATGTNFAVIVVDPFAGTDTGNVNPDTERPGPDATMFEMLSVALPLFDIVNVCVLAIPTAMFPKSKLAGETEIDGCC